MKRTKVLIGVGIGLDKNGRGMSHEAVNAAIHWAREYLLRTYGGFTETVVHGGWKDEKEQSIEETGLQFTVSTASHVLEVHPAIAAAVTIRDLFNQQCVVLETSEVNFEFV